MSQGSVGPETALLNQEAGKKSGAFVVVVFAVALVVAASAGFWGRGFYCESAPSPPVKEPTVTTLSSDIESYKGHLEQHKESTSNMIEKFGELAKRARALEEENAKLRKGDSFLDEAVDLGRRIQEMRATGTAK